jgi:hypothetical protein
MTGLLLGILLADRQRLVGALFGWRVMYQAAAVSIALIGLVMWRMLPRFAIHSTLSYPQLMKSMAHLWQRYPALRRAALAQGALHRLQRLLVDAGGDAARTLSDGQRGSRGLRYRRGCRGACRAAGRRTGR